MCYDSPLDFFERRFPSVSDVNPADSAAAVRPVILDDFNHDPAETSGPPDGDKKTGREGLPAGYRMRADAHYVDQLSARRTDRAPDTLIATTSRDRAELRERRTERVLAQIADDETAIGSAAALLTAETSALGRRAAADVIKAQVARATWMLRANAILDGAHRVHVRSRPLGTLLEHFRERVAIECRLAAISLQILANDGNAAVIVDEEALLTGLTGALVATIGLVGPADGATITVTAGVTGGELRTLELTQDDVAVPANASSRFLDPSWTDRPGGWIAGLGAQTARAVAQQHSGDLVFLAADRRGSTIRFSFSR